MGLLESTLALVLGIWAIACICYVFRVPRIHRLLNRLNWFDVLASWALATTNNIRSGSGAHTLEFCDIDSIGAHEKWTPLIATDCWAWHGFLWFPARLPAGSVQMIGRQLGLLDEMKPLPVKTIATHGAVLEKLVRNSHPLVPGCVRRVRLLRRLLRNGKEEAIVLWQSTDCRP